MDPLSSALALCALESRASPVGGQPRAPNNLVSYQALPTPISPASQRAGPQLPWWFAVGQPSTLHQDSLQTRAPACSPLHRREAPSPISVFMGKITPLSCSESHGDNEARPASAQRGWHRTHPEALTVVLTIVLPFPAMATVRNLSNGIIIAQE